MTHAVVVAARARADVRKNADWLRERFSSRTADRWNDSVVTAIAGLADRPDRHPEADEAGSLGLALRMLLHRSRRQVFRILFTVDGETVTVRRVLHAAQDRLTGGRLVTATDFRVRLSLVVGFFLAATAATALTLAAPPAPPAPAPPLTGGFECRWADSPVVLDGSADEPAWQAAQVVDGFRMPWLGADAPAPAAATRARLLWDRDHLYFFADMTDADLFADVTEHDGDTWNNDVFELFLKPAADRPGYYEFEVTAANAVLDAFFPKRDLAATRDRLKADDFRVETWVKLRGTLNKRDDTDAGWSVEGRIPWADFLRTGGRPEPGERWGLALCRYDYRKGREGPDLSTTADIRTRKLDAFFHQHEDWPAVTFVGPTDRLPALSGPMTAASSTVVGSPDPPPPYRAKRLYPGYAPANPIMAKAAPGTGQLLVLAETRSWGPSALYRLPDDPAATTADAVKLLDTPGGGTAYDFTFHPRFADNRYLYVGWNGPVEGKAKAKACRVTRYTLTPGPPLTLDPASALTILEWESDGHNGAAVCFGADGMLYVTTGDGTSDSDADLAGQRTDTLLSKVLRIDVDRPAVSKPYSVPADNPYVGDKRFAPETWAYGLRNPWRIACDSSSGQLWVGNNGQDLWEQAYLVKKGANYGWSVTEGSHPFYPDRKPGPIPIEPPTVEHGHAEFRSLTGGLVVRGPHLPALDGAYLYADYSTGRVWGIRHDGKRPLWHKELAATRFQVTGFGTNARGELLICDHAPAGGLYTLEPTPPEAAPPAFPRTLSASGLFADVRGHRTAPGVVPYTANAPFWSDGLHKQRFLALPPGGAAGFTPTRGWNFPDRTVVVKSFAVEREEGNPASREWVETRFLTKQAGEWAGYSYRWNAAGTDADLVPSGGADATLRVRTPAGVREQVWHFPSRAECMVCHTRAQNFVLGLCTAQMNRTQEYSGRADNQLAALERAGVLKGLDVGSVGRAEWAAQAAAKGLTGKAADEFVTRHGPQPGQRPVPGASRLPPPTAGLPRMVNPLDVTADLTTRARSWLHANCSACHVESGGGNAQMELEFQTPADKMRALDVKPLHHTFGLPDARLIAPGEPSRSVLLTRVCTRGAGQMPPLATSRVDTAGAAVLRQWVESLKK